MTDETATGERQWRYDRLTNEYVSPKGVCISAAWEVLAYLNSLEVRQAKEERWRKLARRYHEAQTWRLVQEIDEDYDAALADEGPQ